MSDDRRPVPVTLETFLKRSWPVLVAGAVFILLICGFLVSLALSGKMRKTTSDGGPSVSAATSSTSLTPVVGRLLDGVAVPTDARSLQPFAVMVENAPDARPLSGPAKANMVIEAPVEGGITRFMVLFDASTTVSEIGPVRSARPYFVEWANALRSVYGHVGGSPDALSLISSLDGFRNLDEMANGSSFWRSSSRVAPHNAYTKTDLLLAAAETKQWAPQPFTPWNYLLPDATSSQANDAPTVEIPYGGSFSVRWSYNEDLKSYARFQAGQLQKDKDGTIVRATNVIVLLTDGSVLDDVGRLKIRTTGSGKAWLFRDGKRFNLTWRRTAGSWLTFEDVDGTDALLRPGTTWISVVTSAAMAPSDESATSTR